ncbi:MAG: ABC transporter ATP-binding protein [Nitriliruptoraceae bacterium]
MSHEPTPGATATTLDPRRGAEYVIHSVGLTKDYGSLRAVSGVDLQVPSGTVAGFVGPNGAGKTTTIRMLLGLIRPSDGAAHVLGEPIGHPERYLSRVGAMIEGPAFTPSLSGRRNLAALSVLGGHDRARIDELLELVGLTGRGSDPVRAYSTGMKQRLGIAAALLGDPDLLVLDEPTNGLDPPGIKEIRQLLRDLADGGMTVFVSSHLLAEIEQISDWLVMIKAGRLRFQGPVSEAIAAQRPHLLVTAERHEQVEAELTAVCAEHGHAASPGQEGRLVVEAPHDFAGVLNRESAARGITLVELRRESPSLEQTFFNMLEES